VKKKNEKRIEIGSKLKLRKPKNKLKRAPKSSFFFNIIRDEIVKRK
jgi:hypothetical protein